MKADKTAGVLMAACIAGIAVLVAAIVMDANDPKHEAEARAQTVRDVRSVVDHLMFQRHDNGLCFAVAINRTDRMMPQYVPVLVPSEYCPKAEHP